MTLAKFFLALAESYAEHDEFQAYEMAKSAATMICIYIPPVPAKIHCVIAGDASGTKTFSEMAEAVAAHLTDSEETVH